jgi:hypothetical protein
MTHDRAGIPQFPLTHMLLAVMLGVRRASVTDAVGVLGEAGLIRSKHGVLAVLDRAGLEAASCECYGVVRRRYDRLLFNGERMQ